MRNDGKLPGQSADDEKQSSEEEDQSDEKSDSDEEEDEDESSDEEEEDVSQNDANEAQEQCNHECIHTSLLVPKGCESFWIKVSQNHYLSSSFFGFKPAQLEELYSICKDEISQHNWRGMKLKRKTTTKYNLYIIFLISFYWLKCYPTMKVLEGLTCTN